MQGADIFLCLELYDYLGTIQLRLPSHAQHLLLPNLDYHGLNKKLC